MASEPALNRAVVRYHARSSEGGWTVIDLQTGLPAYLSAQDGEKLTEEHARRVAVFLNAHPVNRAALEPKLWTAMHQD